MFRFFKKFVNVPSKILSCGRCGNVSCNSNRGVPTANNISYEELLKKTKEGATLIDVRTKQEFLEKHLDGAILIPYFDINKKVENIVPNKEKEIIVYCQNGGRSLKAYGALKKLGYNNIYNLKGGIEEI